MTKYRLRKQIRQQRARRAVDKLAEPLTTAGHSLMTHLGIVRGSTLGAFLPSAHEPPLTAFLAEIAPLHCLYLPVTKDDGVLTWVAWDAQTPTRPSRHPGIEEPIGPQHEGHVLEGAALVFIPALAVDMHGRRLGQGGGYYDRFLSQLPRRAPGALMESAGTSRTGPVRCAVTFAEEIFTEPVPTDPWDETVDYVLWPHGFLPLS